MSWGRKHGEEQEQTNMCRELTLSLFHAQTARKVLCWLHLARSPRLHCAYYYD